MVKRKRLKKPTKIPNLLPKVREAVKRGDYRDLMHAQVRGNERNITRPEYTHVLRTGRHEKAKDEFNERYESWNYAIRGKTVDGKELRVIVSFDDADMLIITLIDLDTTS